MRFFLRTSGEGERCLLIAAIVEQWFLFQRLLQSLWKKSVPLLFCGHCLGLALFLRTKLLGREVFYIQISDLTTRRPDWVNSYLGLVGWAPSWVLRRNHGGWWVPPACILPAQWGNGQALYASVSTLSFLIWKRWVWLDSFHPGDSFKDKLNSGQ